MKVYPNEQQVSESVRRLNPQLFGGMGIVESSKRKCDPIQTLDGRPKAQGSRPKSLAFCVRLVVVRRRLLDDSDNYIAGCKPLRDAIAQSLGVDDADRFIRWEYNQHETKANEGVIVTITKL